MADQDEIRQGDIVYKNVGDYKFSGFVVARFKKLSGTVRYVVENEDGILHIFSRAQLKKIGDDEDASDWA